MSSLSKVFWGEGLFLRPQHFQRQDAYHEARQQELRRSLHPYAWGCQSVRFDPQSLESGILHPLELVVVFPDGEPYIAPAQDSLPLSLSLADLSQGTHSTLIHLSLPLMREYGNSRNEAQGEENAHVRFHQSHQPTNDLFTNSEDADIAYLRKSVRLLTDDKPRDQYISLPVARINRTPTGGFELDESFIPPCNYIAGSPQLLLDMRRLLDAVQAKVEALYGMHRQPAQHIIEFRSGDIASFWLLHTATSAFATLSHLFHHPDLHPERLFQELLRLAGSLLTFSNLYSLNDLPRYVHAQPEAGFKQLFAIIRELLDTVISSRYFQIQLTEVKPAFHLGRIDSQKIDANTAFYLAVAADMHAAELIKNVPVRFKVGAPDDVEKCVLSALPGVKLNHAPQVPAAIPVRPGSSYFELDARGPLYERMLKSQSISIYVPTGINGLKLELIAVTA
ncbi:type VI secretion system baseplate subunit TssK [Lysobacteraceae bacterium NML03-0222]|nr:type VI secretion system baseplate subunit TssK [Xanthomonadaceae bacterium NML03-0222]